MTELNGRVAITSPRCHGSDERKTSKDSIGRRVLILAWDPASGARVRSSDCGIIEASLAGTGRAFRQVLRPMIYLSAGIVPTDNHGQPQTQTIRSSIMIMTVLILKINKSAPTHDKQRYLAFY
jgi:hypothetical protein